MKIIKNDENKIYQIEFKYENNSRSFRHFSTVKSKSKVPSIINETVIKLPCEGIQLVYQNQKLIDIKEVKTLQQQDNLMFSGKNLLCLEVGYDNSINSVQPYYIGYNLFQEMQQKQATDIIPYYRYEMAQPQRKFLVNNLYFLCIPKGNKQMLEIRDKKKNKLLFDDIKSYFFDVQSVIPLGKLYYQMTYFDIQSQTVKSKLYKHDIGKKKLCFRPLNQQEHINRCFKYFNLRNSFIYTTKLGNSLSYLSVINKKKEANSKNYDIRNIRMISKEVIINLQQITRQQVMYSVIKKSNAKQENARKEEEEDDLVIANVTKKSLIAYRLIGVSTILKHPRFNKQHFPYVFILQYKQLFIINVKNLQITKLLEGQQVNNIKMMGKNHMFIDDKLHTIVNAFGEVECAECIYEYQDFERKIFYFIDKNFKKNCKAYSIHKDLEEYAYETFDNQRRIVRQQKSTHNSLYLGEMNGQNKREGRGVQIQDGGGSIYEGYWVNDNQNKTGRMVHKNGDIYIGSWLDNKYDGQGELTRIDGSKYKGQWKESKQHGKGTETWVDGNEFTGDYFKGKKNGMGIMKFADKSVYDGEWKDNNMCGYGTFLWNEGSLYYGEWLNNMMDGQGTFIYSDGRKYEGAFKNDKKEGNGSLIWPDGREYHGEWLNGNQHGKATITSTQGVKRTGVWQNGKRVKWDDEQDDEIWPIFQNDDDQIVLERHVS